MLMHLWWPEILKIQGSHKQALPKGAFTLKLTILVLWGSPPIWWPEILKTQGSPEQALPKGAFALKLTILVLVWGSHHLVARNPQNPGPARMLMRSICLGLSFCLICDGSSLAC